MPLRGMMMMSCAVTFLLDPTVHLQKGGGSITSASTEVSAFWASNRIFWSDHCHLSPSPSSHNTSLPLNTNSIHLEKLDRSLCIELISWQGITMAVVWREGMSVCGCGTWSHCENRMKKVSTAETVVTACSLVDKCPPFGVTCCLFYPEYGGSNFLLSVWIYQAVWRHKRVKLMSYSTCSGECLDFKSNVIRSSDQWLESWSGNLCMLWFSSVSRGDTENRPRPLSLLSLWIHCLSHIEHWALVSKDWRSELLHST